MIGLGALLKRNIKLFFKDKGMFFTSLITPMILLLLYSTFLANVYRDAFASSIPTGVPIDDKLLDGAVGGQLLSSLLAVCCVTVSFCSNFLMVQDKVTGARGDLTMAPVRRSTLALGYYLASAAATLIICYAAAGASFLYLINVGWYLSGTDVAKILLDVFLLVMFGTALSSVINHFLCTQGQISAVGSIVSAGYGFICGAYIPISQFGETLQTVISFLPGTYATALLRNHAMRGVFAAMEESGIPSAALEGMRAAVDCEIRFFDHAVSESAMYAILVVTVLVLVAAFVLLTKFVRTRVR
ncbi:MAG: ABC transporter permease [Ruminococcaceae bacterium]|nr:ABC transporter permease [Oscillospiraceae bacterium]